MNVDISIAKGIRIAMERNPHPRFVTSIFCLCRLVNIKQLVILIEFMLTTGQKGLLMKFFSGTCVTREGWFATGADSISLPGWDQVVFFLTSCSR